MRGNGFMTSKTTYCVLSHTHWDREWYQSFEQFRMRLCDLINNLLDILEKYPDYIFHMDAQTIVLEDYLEIYPENEQKIKDYIKKGNIVVGPWYVQNDFYLSSGEATVRNIIIGSDIAEKFGKCEKVGYTPDQFGLCSQLPQIFNGFDINYHLFGRGYNVYEDNGNGYELSKKDINFLWVSPDGSKVNSTLMPFWYNNAQRFTSKIDVALERLENSKSAFSERTDSPYLVMMNGVDHLEPQGDLLPILDSINKRLTDDEIKQCNMLDVMKLNAPYAKDVVKGELRYGAEGSILAGTFSTRTDIKKLNFDAQNMIEHKIEPLYSLISLMGCDMYPSNQIKYLWKTLIPNHAHDSICCCSTPNVMKNMEDRYLRINDVGNELIARGARFVNHHISRDVKGDGVYYFTVINTNQLGYTGVMECEFNIAIDDADKDFKIFAPDGSEAEYTIIDKHQDIFCTFTALNLPGAVDVMRYKVMLYVKNVPPFGYVNYTVKTGYDYVEAPDAPALENEYIKVDFDGDKVNITNKVNDVKYNDCLWFEDIGDWGESYVFQPCDNDTPIKAKLLKVETVYANSIKSKVCLEYSLDIPFELDGHKRAGEIVTNKLWVYLSLGKGEKALTVDVKYHNMAKYHLTKAVINTDIDNTITFASSVYDVIKRDTKDIIREIRTNCSQPVNGFVYKKAQNSGVAVFTKGLYEYENENNKLIKLSLLRSMDRISTFSLGREWRTDENVMLGTYNTTFAIMPFGDDEQIIPAMEQNINSQPLYHFDSTNIRMFTGGRAIVQDGNVDELYYNYDKYENLNLPHVQQFIDVDETMCVTALKKAENSKNTVIRMYNPWDDAKRDVLTVLLDKNLVKTNLAETKETEFDNFAGKKEIVTVVIK